MFSQFSLKLSRVSLLPISILNFTRAHTSIYSVRVLENRWENSNKTHLKFPQKTSHMGGVTFFYYDTS